MRQHFVEQHSSCLRTLAVDDQTFSHSYTDMLPALLLSPQQSHLSSLTSEHFALAQRSLTGCPFGPSTDIAWLEAFKIK